MTTNISKLSELLPSFSEKSDGVDHLKVAFAGTELAPGVTCEHSASGRGDGEGDDKGYSEQEYEEEEVDYDQLPVCCFIIMFMVFTTVF